MERVEQLKDPEILEQAKEAAKPKPVIPKEELEAQAQAEREALIEKKKAEEAAFLYTLKGKGIKRWDYKHLRLDYKGRGITQEINLLDIDGERVRGLVR